MIQMIKYLHVDNCGFKVSTYGYYIEIKTHLDNILFNYSILGSQ